MPTGLIISLLSAFALIEGVFVVAYVHLCLTLQKRIDTMAVSAAAQAIVDELNAAAGTLPQITGAAVQATEDLAAIKTAADGLSSAIAAALPAPPVEVVEG